MRTRIARRNASGLKLAFCAGLTASLLSAGCQTAKPVGTELAEAIQRVKAQRLGRNAAPNRPTPIAERDPADDRVVLGELAAAGPVDYHTLMMVLGDQADDEPAEKTSEEPVSEKSTAAKKGPTGLDGGFWSTLKRDIRHAPGELWSDTKATYWNSPNALVLVLAGGASLALRPEVDDDIADKYRRSRSLSPSWGDTAGVLGNPGTHFGLAAAAYAYSVLAKDETNYQRSKTLLSALIINGASTLLLQAAANTEAPNGEELGWPSGHTSSTMTVAAVMDEFYGPWVGVPLYGLTGLVALERLDDREHEFSDVVFGAVLGYVIGKTVARKRHPKLLGGEITPYIDASSGTSGIAWVKRF